MFSGSLLVKTEIDSAKKQPAAEAYRLLLFGMGFAGFGGGLVFLVLLRPVLQVVLQAHAFHQFELGFQPIGAFFVFVFLFFQQLAGNVVLLFFAHGNGFHQCLVFVLLFLQVAADDFFGIFADQQFAKLLQVGQAFQQEDALDQGIGCRKMRAMSLSAFFMARMDCLYMVCPTLS